MMMDETYSSLAARPYAGNGELLNDLVSHILKRVSWDLLTHQEEIAYSASECPDGIPMLRENAIACINKYIDAEFSWLRQYIITHVLMSYRLDNIDLGEEGEEWLREELGTEGYAEWESRARRAIYADYAKMLGEEEAAAYFEKIGRSYYKDGDVSDLD